MRRFSQPFRRYMGLFALGGAMALAVLPVSARATAIAPNDPLIAGGKLCTQQFPVQEQQQHIPTHLLAAISTTESGRWHKELGMAVPWPWTINVNGKGYYFNTKAEAIARTQSLLAAGQRSIDVGCMQVNLKHHAGAFANLNEAFEPATNVAYAAKFLRDNYAELGDWIKATAAYHSRTEARGREYLVQIERSWNHIVTKVAAARANQGAMVSSGASSSTTEMADARPVKRDPAPELDDVRPASHPIKNTHRQQVIKVDSESKTARNGSPVVIVGGTQTAASSTASGPTQEVASAAAAPVVDATPAQAPAGDSVRRVTLDNPASTAQPTPHAQARSVFVN